MAIGENPAVRALKPVIAYSETKCPLRAQVWIWQEDTVSEIFILKLLHDWDETGLKVGWVGMVVSKKEKKKSLRSSFSVIIWTHTKWQLFWFFAPEMLFKVEVKFYEIGQPREFLKMGRVMSENVTFIKQPKQAIQEPR